MRESLFDKYGGYGIFHDLATQVYENALSSPVLGPYFEHADMATLIRHQSEFLAGLMGGPVRYSNKDLEHIHRFLDITSEAFDVMICLLRDALYRLRFDEPDILFLEAELLRRKRFIVSRNLAASA